MAAWLWLLISIVAVVAVVVIVGIAMKAARTRRTAGLRDRFGAEYDRRVESAGDRKAGEAELRDVTKRRERLDIRPLSEASRGHYSDRWQVVQSGFVDQPDRAVGEADSLVAEVMRERGYPVDDFDERIDMVAVDHPAVAEHYRAGHALFLRNQQRMASTDDLRQALLHYRSLFDELLESSPASR